MTGRLYGVGVGPGDPELLTLKGMRVLQEADVISAPVSEPHGGSMALGIVEKKGLLRGKEVLRLVFPMTRDKEVLRKSRRDAAERIMRELEKGRDVAFVTLGDPGLYSTFTYLVEELGEKIDIKTVPGVTSISACLAASNESLARGTEGTAILPASEAEGRLGELLEDFDSVVLLKAKRVKDIIEELRELGALGNALVFAKCGSDDFQVLPLSGLDTSKREYFSMILIRGLK